jgi:hypothetical protein
VPIVIEDACGFGNASAAARSVEQMRFNGDVILTDEKSFITALSDG